MLGCTVVLWEPLVFRIPGFRVPGCKCLGFWGLRFKGFGFCGFRVLGVCRLKVYASRGM